jgi:hypothetical protein
MSAGVLSATSIQEPVDPTLCQMFGWDLDPDHLRRLAIRIHQNFGPDEVSTADVRNIRAMPAHKLCRYVGSTLARYEHRVWIAIQDWDQSGSPEPSSQVRFLGNLWNIPYLEVLEDGGDRTSAAWATNQVRRQEFADALYKQYEAWLGPKGWIARLGSQLKTWWALLDRAPLEQRRRTGLDHKRFVRRKGRSRSRSRRSTR